MREGPIALLLLDSSSTTLNTLSSIVGLSLLLSTFRASLSCSKVLRLQVLQLGILLPPISLQHSTSLAVKYGRPDGPPMSQADGVCMPIVQFFLEF